MVELLLSFGQRVIEAVRVLAVVDSGDHMPPSRPVSSPVPESATTVIDCSGCPPCHGGTVLQNEAAAASVEDDALSRFPCRRNRRSLAPPRKMGIRIL